MKVSAGTLISDTAATITLKPVTYKTITALSANYNDVFNAVKEAVHGDTVLVPETTNTTIYPGGVARWSSSLSTSKGIFLKGAGNNQTKILWNGATGSAFINIGPSAAVLANDHTIRVEGFSFDGAEKILNFINVFGPNTASVAGVQVAPTKAFNNLAIGNNTFKNAQNVDSGSGAIHTTGQVRGVIFDNTFDRVNVVLKIMGSNDSGQEWASGNFPQSFGNEGGGDNLYFENNTIAWSSAFPLTDTNVYNGWIESGQGGRLVVRYNSWNMDKADNTDNLWDVHGFQNWHGNLTDNGQTGTMVVEYYGNKVTNAAFSRLIVHRGGWGMFFDNVVTGTGGAGISMQQYGDHDSGGSGLTKDMPGATGVYKTEINNTYIFNNTKNGQPLSAGYGSVGGKIYQMDANGNYVLNSQGDRIVLEWYVKPNIDFWNENAVTEGTLPPTGTAAIGSVYWQSSGVDSVTGKIVPSVDRAIIESSKLWKFTATGWQVFYTPYGTHPLVTGVNGAAQLMPAPLNMNEDLAATSDLTELAMNAAIERATADSTPVSLEPVAMSAPAPASISTAPSPIQDRGGSAPIITETVVIAPITPAPTNQTIAKRATRAYEYIVNSLKKLTTPATTTTTTRKINRRVPLKKKI